jgi:4-alpha-glucanotransferase
LVSGMRVRSLLLAAMWTTSICRTTIIRNVVAYTGTHDNDTTVGWLQSVAGADSTRTQTEINSEREFCKKYLHTQAKRSSGTLSAPCFHR